MIIMLFHFIHSVQGIIFAVPGFLILEYQLVCAYN